MVFLTIAHVQLESSTVARYKFSLSPAGQCQPSHQRPATLFRGGAIVRLFIMYSMLLNLGFVGLIVRILFVAF